MAGFFSRRDAVATKVLVAANVLIFFMQQLAGPHADALLVSVFGLSKAGLENWCLWQPLTHMFLHGSFFHLLVNMLALWFAGRGVELWLGPKRYLAVYFAGGICGGLLQVFCFPGGNLIGASGGVCAVLLAFTTLEPEMPITALLFFVIPVNVRSKFLGYGVILVSLVLPLVGLDPQVGHFAHLGGALTGMLYSLWLRKTGRYHSRTAPGDIRRRFEGGGPGEHSRARCLEGRWHSTGAAKEMDRILNKVVAEGLHSLTAEERGLLENWNRQRARQESGR